MTETKSEKRNRVIHTLRDDVEHGCMCCGATVWWQRGYLPNHFVQYKYTSGYYPVCDKVCAETLTARLLKRRAGWKWHGVEQFVAAIAQEVMRGVING